jgi:hypothetical protein
MLPVILKWILRTFPILFVQTMGLLWCLTDAPAASCDIRLNEFCAGPAQDWNQSGLYSARDDEWIELVNDGAIPVDLSQYVISDADSTWRWSGSDVIQPGERRLLFGSDAVTWQQATGASVAGFSLANAGDTVRLFRLEGGVLVQVDSYAYKAHEAGSDRSVGRVPDASGEWALFDGMSPYTGTLDPPGNDCMPTPNAVNTCTITPAADVTWGKLKAAYR